MKPIFALACVFILAVTTQAADRLFVTGEILTARVRTDYNGEMGFKFTNTTSVPVVITQLGRWVLSGDNQPHTLSIYDTSAQPVLQASVTVNTAGATAGQFLYGTLSTPYSVSPGASCLILSSENQYLDPWYDYDGTFPTTAPIGTIQAAWIDSGGPHMVPSSNGAMFGPVTFAYSSAGFPDWTKSGTVYTTSGELNSVASAVNDASEGDTIMIPAGSFTWGEGGAAVRLTKAVNVSGAGQGQTIITLHPTAASGTSGTFQLFGPATVGNLTINGSATGSATPFSTGPQGGWRITHVTYDATGANGAGNGPATDDAYFVYVGDSPSGLIDNCALTGYGSAELIFTRGPENAWQTPNSAGTANAIYVEDCTFSGAGTVSNFNSNTRAVVRFCTITNQLKIHAQGFDANGPARSYREIEAYENTFKDLAGAQGIDISGGTGYLFNNRSLNANSDQIWLILESWGCQGYWDNDGRTVTGLTTGNPTILTTASPHGLVTGMTVKIKAPYATPALDYTTAYTATVVDATHFSIPVNITTANATNALVTREQTPFDQPLPDQIGTGMDVSGPYSGGRGSDPMYLWNNSAQGGDDWSLAWKVPDPDAIATYRAQMGDSTATFTMHDMIVADRDYYKHTIGGPLFNGTSGVGVGTKATMLAINPGAAHAGVGFWVTDEGSWNQNLPSNTSGQLYVWNGTAWVLKYTPFTYPHPARQGDVEPPPPDLPFVNGTSLSSWLRNGTTFQVGFRFTNETNAPVVITQLGRWVLSGNNQPHTLSIYDTAATPTQLASVTVNCAGATVGQFVYGTLSTPFSVPVGGSCVIVSSERQDLDTWCDNAGTIPATAPVGSIQANWIDGSGSHISPSSAGTMFGPLSFKYSSAGAPTWTKSGSVYATSGTLNSVASAAANASDGDTVMIPAGSFTWGTGAAAIRLTKAIKVLGAGAGSTIITLDPTAPNGTSGLFQLFGPATVGNLTINGSPTGAAVPFSTGPQGGWRITHLTYDATGASGAGNGTAHANPYFVYVGNSPSGLIDNCTLIGAAGDAELIFSRGPEDAWQTPDTPGTANAIYVEDCTFSGAGYVSDFNSNTRAVVRFCTINNQMKIDGHGFDSNTPARSFREIEAYENTFQDSAGAQAFDIRGGTGFIFNNQAVNIELDNILLLLESYACQGYWTNYGHEITAMTVGYPTVLTTAQPHGLVTGMPVKLQAPHATPALDYSGAPYIATVIDATHFSIPVNITNADAAGALVTRDQTPFDQPLPDQIGIGMDVSGPYSGGRGSDPMYLWNNSVKNGADWAIKWKTPDADAVTVYRLQTGNPSATFTMSDMIVPDRDVYKHTIGATFDGTSGVGLGTKATMLAINPGPAHAGVGFWVTDEGSWNTKKPSPNTSGQLYVWNGSAWVLKYTPFTYPHPAQSP